MSLSLKCRAVANYIIEETNKFNTGKNFREQIMFTTKRLQKMLYLCEIEYMKRNNGEVLFEDEFYAWPSGPVIEEIYTKYMPYSGYGVEPRYEKGEPSLSKEEKLIVEQVLCATNDLDTCDLIYMCIVPGGPHSKVFKEDDKEYKQIVSKQKTYAYYSKHDPFCQLGKDDSNIKGYAKIKKR